MLSLSLINLHEAIIMWLSIIIIIIIIIIIKIYKRFPLPRASSLALTKTKFKAETRMCQSPSLPAPEELQCHSDMGIPIPKTLVMWASPQP